VGILHLKYMGSKKHMLKNGLGELLLESAKASERFVDLFCGGCSVAWFVGEKTSLPVVATDIQNYAVVSAKSILMRTETADANFLAEQWLAKAAYHLKRNQVWTLLSTTINQENVEELAKTSRMLCQEKKIRTGPIWAAYGGFYFSPTQALSIDYLIKYLPDKEEARSLCFAALLDAASKCVAAPGHTAQPFKPNDTAGKYLIEAWARDPFEEARKALVGLCQRHALTRGSAHIADAVSEAAKLNEGDLVFVDPPYSGVQYSRFYHVYETIVNGYCGKVSGAGRYPMLQLRPQSHFSNVGQSGSALWKLLENLAVSKCKVVFTFPKGKCSNGLSGDDVLEASKKLFKIDKEMIKGRFSTLGGNNKNRDARQGSQELVMMMHPR